MRLLQEPQLNAILSVGAVLAASALSAFVTYKVTTRSIQAASVEGAKQRKHERLLAREQLTHQSKRDAYVMIQKYLMYWEGFALAHSTRLVLAPDPSQDVPPIVNEDVEALANLMASDRVNEGVKEVQSHLSLLHLELQTAQDFEAAIPAGIPDAREQMSSARSRARQAAADTMTAIRTTKEHMRAELFASRSEDGAAS